MLPIVTVHHLPQPQRCANTHTGRAWGHYYCRYICLNEDAWQCVCACLLLCVGVCFDFWFDLPTINTKSWGVCWESVSTHWYECSESNLAYMLMQHVTPLMWLLSPTVLCKKKGTLYIKWEQTCVLPEARRSLYHRLISWVDGKENGLWSCVPAHFISCYNNWQ